MSRIEGDVYVNGHLSAKTQTIPAGTVTDAMVSGSADISATKLEHQHCLTYSQARGVDNADARTIIHRVYGATGSIVSFKAKNAVAALNSDTTTIDLYVNGSSVLTSVITLSAADGTNVDTAAGFSSTALVQGDIIEVVINATGSDPGEGVAAFLAIREDAQ